MEASRTYIRQTLRYLMLLIGLACAGLMALPQAATSFLPQDYSYATAVLFWSAPAYFCFSLFNMVNTLLMSAGRAASAFVIGVITVLLAALLYHFYLPVCSTPLGLIVGAAQASLCAFAIGLILGLIRLAQLFSNPLPIMSVIRVLISSALVIFIGQWITHTFPHASKFMLLAALMGLALCYLVFLTLLKEWNADDRTRLRRLTRRKA